MNSDQIERAMEERGWIATAAITGGGYSMEPDEGERDVYALVTSQRIEFGSTTVHVGQTIIVDDVRNAMTPTLARIVFDAIAYAYYAPSDDKNDDTEDDEEEFEAQFALPIFE